MDRVRCWVTAYEVDGHDEMNIEIRMGGWVCDVRAS